MSLFKKVVNIVKKEKNELDKIFLPSNRYKIPSEDDVDQNILFMVIALTTRMIVDTGKVPYTKSIKNEQIKKLALSSDEVEKYILFISLFRVYCKINIVLREPHRDNKSNESKELVKILYAVFKVESLEEAPEFKINIDKAIAIGKKILSSENDISKKLLSSMNMLLVSYIEDGGVMNDKLKKDFINKDIKVPIKTYENAFNYIAESFSSLPKLIFNKI